MSALRSAVCAAAVDSRSDPGWSRQSRSDPGWNLYHDAFRALGAGRKTEATRLLESLIAHYPAHAASQRGQWVLVDLEAGAHPKAIARLPSR
ncbi:MAG: hypothetical protein MJD61_22940 [Proteobacteria bacterium]|nr:hypothetical protein [Pseudomonadota bacterium]